MNSTPTEANTINSSTPDSFTAPLIGTVGAATIRKALLSRDHNPATVINDLQLNHSLQSPDAPHIQSLMALMGVSRFQLYHSVFKILSSQLLDAIPNLNQAQ